MTRVIKDGTIQHVKNSSSNTGLASPGELMSSALQPAFMQDCSLNAAGWLQSKTEGTPSLSQEKATLDHIYRWTGSFNRENALLTPALCKFYFVSQTRMGGWWCQGGWPISASEVLPGWALQRHSMYPVELLKEERSLENAARELRTGLRGWFSVLHFSARGSSVYSKGLCVRKDGCSIGLGRVRGRPTWRAGAWKPVGLRAHQLNSPVLACKIPHHPRNMHFSWTNCVSHPVKP